MENKIRKGIEVFAIILFAVTTIMCMSCSGDEEITPANAAKSNNHQITFSVKTASGACLDGAQLMAWVDIDNKLSQGYALSCSQASGSATLSTGDLLELHIYAPSKDAATVTKVKAESYIFTVTQNGKTYTFEQGCGCTFDSKKVQYIIK